MCNRDKLIIIQFQPMLEFNKRYQVGFYLAQMFPALNGICACGCGRLLPKNKRKWYSKECNDLAFIKFAIVKGDIRVIRAELQNRDNGFCRHCGVFDELWEADHILPVSKYGGGCEIENFQTLCQECHKKKTQTESQRAAISSQQASTEDITRRYASGLLTKLREKTSNETHSLRFGSTS